MSSDVPGGSGGGQDTTVSESEVDVLNEGTETSSDEDTVVPDKGEDEGESEEPSAEVEDDEELEAEEPEEEEEEELEEELEAGEEPTRPSWQLIKEKYPDLAKDKDFRELYFRDKAYTEVFPTVADAKSAFEKAEQLDAVDATLVSGDVDTIFATLKPEVLNGIADRILPALYNSDQRAFARAARPLINNVLHLVLDKANREGDDNLRKSIRNISRALTGNPDLPNRDNGTPDPQIEAERNRLQEERRGLYIQQERNFLGNCDKAVMKKLETIAVEGIDPKGQFTNFTRQAILERTLRDVQHAMLSDPKLRTRLQQMHRLAARSGFPDEYRARIISASLERAKQLIPVFRDKHRRAALGRQSSAGNNKEKIVTKNETVASGGRTSRGRIDMKRTSAEDFLNDKVTYRKQESSYAER